jgi:hypothetical protein
LCPSPCQTVRTDDLTEKAGGSDVGFHLGAEYFPGNSWYGFYSQFARTRYKGVYDPDRPLAYPRDWTDHNLFLGATVRTKSFFGR